MHEASLTKNLLKKILEIAEREQASRVLSVQVRLGALSHMSPGHFREHFDAVAGGTIAEGAAIEAVEETDIASPTATEVILESVDLA